MTPTIQTFIQALLTPDLAFETLTDARPVTGAEGLPRLMRTTRFAEAEIDWHGKHWLLSLPLSSTAMVAAERTAARLGRLNTDRLTEYRILPQEMRWTDTFGETRRCDLVLQHLPQGIPFTQAIHMKPTDRLTTALDALRKALRELNIAHGNLRESNLWWAGDRFIPLRYHNVRFGDPGFDDPAFETLRETILRKSDPMRVSDVEAPYDPLRKLTGHLRVNPIFEGLACVEDETGYGYVDTGNRVVIPATFRWAANFREGRAEVRTETGMGLIDRQGKWIIPPLYEIVEYDEVESIVHVRQNGLWAEFDYLGRKQAEFGTVTFMP